MFSNLNLKWRAAATAYLTLTVSLKPWVGHQGGKSVEQAVAHEESAVTAIAHAHVCTAPYHPVRVLPAGSRHPSTTYWLIC